MMKNRKEGFTLNKEMQLIRKSNRDSNIELLRIIAMCMIVFYHLSINTGVLDGNNINISMILGIIGGIGGKIGVVTYVLITRIFYMCQTF